MDYQTFHAAHTHPVNPPPLPQQHLPHAHFDPHAVRLPQSTPPLPYGGSFAHGPAAAFPPLAAGAVGGSVNAMQAGMPQNPRAAALHQQQHQQQPPPLPPPPSQLAQHQQHQPHPHQHPHQHQQQQQQLQAQHPYGSPAVMSPAHQQFAPSRQTASPASNSGQQPYGTPQAQPSPGTLASNGPHMNPQAPGKSDPPQVHTPVKQATPSPVSPIAHARAQDRMATLLEINSILIKEVCDLQAQGKAGQVGAAPDAKSEGDKSAPSKEYVEYMRRLQVNLAYLAQSAEKTHKPGQQLQPGPAIMSAPSGPPEFIRLYTKLQDLFPGWKGGTVAQMKQSPGPHQRISSNSSQPPMPMQPQTPQQSTPNSAGPQPIWSQNTTSGMGMGMGMGMDMGVLANQAQTKMEPQL